MKGEQNQALRHKCSQPHPVPCTSLFWVGPLLEQQQGRLRVPSSGAHIQELTLYPSLQVTLLSISAQLAPISWHA